MAGLERETRLHTKVPVTHVFAALEQVVDARVKPGHDESQADVRMIRKLRGSWPYSAGVGVVGAGGVPPVEARRAAAFFSTIRTAQIEPS